jgi:hypothetical protein
MRTADTRLTASGLRKVSLITKIHSFMMSRREYINGDSCPFMNLSTLESVQYINWINSEIDIFHDR